MWACGRPVPELAVSELNGAPGHTHEPSAEAPVEESIRSFREDTLAGAVWRRLTAAGRRLLALALGVPLSPSHNIKVRL